MIFQLALLAKLKSVAQIFVILRIFLRSYNYLYLYFFIFLKKKNKIKKIVHFSFMSLKASGLCIGGSRF